MTRYLIPTLLFTALAAAQPPAKPAPPKAPEIPATLVTKTFKAQAELANAQLQTQRASQTVTEKTQAMQRVLAELQQACGDKYEPTLNPAGDPVCVAKPEAKK